MVLTSRVAQNYEKMIKSGRYSAKTMLDNIEAAYVRELMTLAEKEYLDNLVAEYLVKQSDEEVKKLGK